ncbi:uncharacterized protein [Typha latifolia]|uniref:uncharacterized protein n=1 Tax=Typha latifolia TaxID=4733 RepID=UPI003C2ED721
MVYTYTPAYYTSFQDTITSICKSILPFSFKNRRLTADQKLAKRHADNLKWQQESFHRILNLIGLHKEGIVPESDVSAFRTHLLDTLIASPPDQEPPAVIRDKLLFLQELLHAKCISADDYHASKRPLLQRLAVQGVEIDCRDVVVGPAPRTTSDEEEWTVIELRDKEPPSAVAEENKHRTPIKSLISKPWRGKGKKGGGPLCPIDQNKGSILMPESSPLLPDDSDKAGKRKPPLSAKKQWGFDGFKKWRRSNSEEEPMAPNLPPPHGERSDGGGASSSVKLVAAPVGVGPDTKKIKKEMLSDGSASDFFVDKVLGENIKKELSRIQSELSATNPNLNFSYEQVEVISTRLPIDKSDLNGFFPKSWCDRYGDVVLDVVKKEFKEHVGEMESLRNPARENKSCGSRGCTENYWVAFKEENDENLHPNLFSSSSQPLWHRKEVKNDDKNCHVNNPLYDEKNPFLSARDNN